MGLQKVSLRVKIHVFSNFSSESAVSSVPVCLSTSLLRIKGDMCPLRHFSHLQINTQTSLCSCPFLKFNPSVTFPSLLVTFQTISLTVKTLYDLSFQAHLHYFLHLKFEQDEGVSLSLGGSQHYQFYFFSKVP